MESNNFNFLRFIDNGSVGGKFPIDDFTQALWIFDGSEVEGSVKDWSDNKNHLIPSEPLQYEFSPFGKVLNVNSGITLESKSELNIGRTEPRCIEILWSNNIENSLSGSNPYNTYDPFGEAPFFQNLSSYIFESKISENEIAVFGIKDDGTICTIGKNGPNLDVVNVLFTRSPEADNRLQTGNSPVHNKPYYHPLHPKNWYGVAINFALNWDGNSVCYINGNAHNMQTFEFNYQSPIGGEGKFTLFPNPPFNFVKNIAYIRISNKIRSPVEINQMMNYFSTADGYFKNLKFHESPKGRNSIYKLSADTVMEFSAPLKSIVPVDVDYVSSGIRFSQIDSVGKVFPLTSGLPNFDYGYYGEGNGLVIKDKKENLFVYNNNGANADFSGESWSDYSSNDGSFVAPYNHDSCTQPVYGDYYGYTGPDGFHYWNLVKTLDTDKYYTMSCWVKKTERVSDNGFYMTISNHGNPVNFNFTGQYAEVISASPLFSGIDYNYSASNRINFAFLPGDYYGNWVRLWVTFKMFTDVDPDYLQITHDNQEGISRPGQGDVWAMDCHQFEEGGLSSWTPDYYNEGFSEASSFTIDGSNFMFQEHGTVMFDYYTNNTYSGINDKVNIISLGENFDIYQRGQYLGVNLLGFDQEILDPVFINASETYRMAMSWSGRVTLYYLKPSGHEENITFMDVDTNGYEIKTNKDSTISGVCYNIKNLKIFQDALSIDELNTFS